VTHLFHKNLSSFLLIGLITALTISCQPKTRKLDLNALADPEVAKKEKIIEQTKTCDNPVDSANLQKELLEGVMTIEDEISIKNIEHIDCQGNTFWKGRGPERHFRKSIEIAPPSTAETTKVNFVQIENTRTCTTQRISPADDTVFDQKEINLENGTKVPVQISKTMANPKGSLKLMLTDSIYNDDANALNIRNGENVITIKYYGKCIKFRENIEEKFDDAYNCETAELIKTKEVYINIKINRPETNDSSKLVLCSQGEDKK
jgi:hypothetical protein